MAILTTLFIAVGLAMDAFAVSTCVGTTQHARTARPVFRLAFHMGLFQGLMTFLGWLAGSSVAHFISSIDHWIALALLAFIGVRMIRSGLSTQEECYEDEDPSRGRMLLMLCVATSIDAMAVGLGMAMLGTEIVLPSLIIGVVTFGLCLVGLMAGGLLGGRFGKSMEVLGGLILNGIGLRILFSHVFVR